MSFGIVILIICLILVCMYIFYSRVILFLSVFLSVVFFLSLAGLITPIFTPGIYNSFVENLFNDAPLAEQFIKADESLNSVVGTSSEVRNDIERGINDLLGRETGEQNVADFSIYDSTISLLAGILRFFIFILSFVVAMFSVYVRYSYAGVIESNKLKHRVTELEARLDKLE